jgi:hypothetical protein
MRTGSRLTVHAQVESGRIVGTVYDQNKAVIPSAAVTVTNVATNTSQKATTSADGDFVITPVDPGVYDISVIAPGFKKMVRTGVEIQVGQIAREDFSMPVGQSTTTIEVSGQPPLLNSDNATVGQVITNRQIVNLPLNGRGFYQLAQLTPGAALLPPTGNSVAVRPESIDGNTISGIRGSALSFLLDGVDVASSTREEPSSRPRSMPYRNSASSRTPTPPNSIAAAASSTPPPSPAPISSTAISSNSSAMTRSTPATSSPSKESPSSATSSVAPSAARSPSPISTVARIEPSSSVATKASVCARALSRTVSSPRLQSTPEISAHPASTKFTTR